MYNMNSSDYLKLIYDSVSSKHGKTFAKEYISTAMFNMIFDLEESGQLGPDALEAALKEEAEFCQRAASKDVA